MSVMFVCAIVRKDNVKDQKIFFRIEEFNSFCYNKQIGVN